MVKEVNIKKPHRKSPTDLPKKPRNLKKPPTEMNWEMDEPKRQERVQLFKKCKKCILVPPKPSQDKNDPKNYKFPICTKLENSNGKCEFNCKGVVAANRRARLTKKYPKIVELTRKLIDEWKCTKKSQQQPKKPIVTIKKKATATKPKATKSKISKSKATKSKISK